MNDQRQIEFEIKISHQEVAIEELQTTVSDLHATVERLEKAVKLITERLISGSAGTVPKNEKPPHY